MKMNDFVTCAAHFLFFFSQKTTSFENRVNRMSEGWWMLLWDPRHDLHYVEILLRGKGPVISFIGFIKHLI